MYRVVEFDCRDKALGEIIVGSGRLLLLLAVGKVSRLVLPWCIRDRDDWVLRMLVAVHLLLAPLLLRGNLQLIVEIDLSLVSHLDSAVSSSTSCS